MRPTHPAAGARHPAGRSHPTSAARPAAHSLPRVVALLLVQGPGAAAIALFLVLRAPAEQEARGSAATGAMAAADPAEAVLLDNQLAQTIYEGDSGIFLQAVFNYEEPSR